MLSGGFILYMPSLEENGVTVFREFKLVHVKLGKPEEVNGYRFSKLSVAVNVWLLDILSVLRWTVSMSRGGFSIKYYVNQPLHPTILVWIQQCRIITF